MNRPTAILISAFLLCTLAGLLTGCDDFEMHQQQVATYCDMVARWKSDEAIGVPAEQRDGWPDYRNEYESVCLDSQRRIENELMAQRAGRG